MAEEQSIIAATTIAVATEVAKDAYNDIAHPVLSATGNVLAIIPHAVERALLPVQQWVAEGQYRLAETKKMLAIKLENIAPEQIVSPEPHIAVPALHAISYSMGHEELREMFANLLASSMHRDKKNDVHPAFVEIIKQLTPDEARLLRAIQEYNDEIPLIDVILLSNTTEGGYSFLASNLSVMDRYTHIEHANNLPAMLDNLERLKLIEISKDEYILDEASYDELKLHPTIKKLKQNFNRTELDFKKKCLRLTQFGRLFCSISISCNFCYPQENVLINPGQKLKSNSYAEWEVIQQLEKI